MSLSGNALSFASLYSSLGLKVVAAAASASPVARDSSSYLSASSVFLSSSSLFSHDSPVLADNDNHQAEDDEEGCLASLLDAQSVAALSKQSDYEAQTLSRLQEAAAANKRRKGSQPSLSSAAEDAFSSSSAASSIHFLSDGCSSNCDSSETLQSRATCS